MPLRFYYQDHDYRYRYSEAGHLDLADMLTDYGASRSTGGLDAMARLIGLPGKVGVDGSQVEGLYNAGQLELIKNYCLSDVAQTAFLFLRFRLLHLGDTMVVVDQATLPDRLAAAGFTEITVHRVAGQLRFSARKP